MKTLLLLTTLLFTATSATAQYAYGPATPPPGYGQNQQLLDPRETVQQGVERLQAFIEGKALPDPSMIEPFIQKEISPYFDFETMAKLILGPLEYQLTPKQQYAVLAMVRQQFLAALASNLMNYRGGSVNYMNISGNLAMGRVNVRLSIYRPDQYPMLIELRLMRGMKGWKIYDVSANGVSAVAHYRNYVQSVIMRQGVQGLNLP